MLIYNDKNVNRIKKNCLPCNKTLTTDSIISKE